MVKIRTPLTVILAIVLVLSACSSPQEDSTVCSLHVPRGPVIVENQELSGQSVPDDTVYLVVITPDGKEGFLPAGHVKNNKLTLYPPTPPACLQQKYIDTIPLPKESFTLNPEAANAMVVHSFGLVVGKDKKFYLSGSESTGEFSPSADAPTSDSIGGMHSDSDFIKYLKLVEQNKLVKSQNALGKAIERLSQGLRIRGAGQWNMFNYDPDAGKLAVKVINELNYAVQPPPPPGAKPIPIHPFVPPPGAKIEDIDWEGYYEAVLNQIVVEGLPEITETTKVFTQTVNGSSGDEEFLIGSIGTDGVFRFSDEAPTTDSITAVIEIDLNRVSDHDAQIAVAYQLFPQDTEGSIEIGNEEFWGQLWYADTAFEVKGHSENWNQEYDIAIEPGWNLILFPLADSDDTQLIQSAPLNSLPWVFRETPAP